MQHGTRLCGMRGVSDGAYLSLLKLALCMLPAYELCDVTLNSNEAHNIAAGILHRHQAEQIPELLPILPVVEDLQGNLLLLQACGASPSQA